MIILSDRLPLGLATSVTNVALVCDSDIVTVKKNISAFEVSVCVMHS
jgi:hypothetical protein